MPLCDIDDGLKLRVLGILFLLSAYYAGLMERYEGYTIVKENNFDQYDGPATLDSLKANYDFSVLVRILYLFLGIHIVTVLALPFGNKLPRLKISVYKVYFPMSFCLDFLVLILFLESSNSAEYSSIVPFVNIASIYSCYHSEGSFILKYLVRKLTELFIRYRLTRIVLYAVFLTIHAVLFVFAWKIIGTQCFEYVWRFVDPNNFMTFEFCDNFKKFSHIERTENTSDDFHTESLKRYILSGSNPKSYSLHYEINFTDTHSHSRRQPPFFHEKHERTIHEDTEFTCAYRFICTDCLNKREPTFWSKDGSLFVKASEKYKATTTYSDIENSTWTQSYSTLTLYDIKQSDYGEYRCLFRHWSKQYNDLNVQSSVVGRYHLVPREHKVNFVHVPLGNSISIQWCPLHVNHKSEDVEHTHFVDGRSITGFHDETGNECSALPYFYHLLSYYTGWINIPHPSNTNVPSYKVRSDLDFIAIWLNTCANLYVYGRHNISLIREIYNTKMKRMQLVEIEHPTQIIILPKTPYMYNYDNKTQSSNTHNLNRALVGCTDSDSLVLTIRITAEALLFFALLIVVIYQISIGWCIYRRLVIFPIRNWILCDVKKPIEGEKTFKVVVFCSEIDSPQWDSANIQLIERMTESEILFIHRDLDYLAGMPFSEMYSEIFKQTNAVIIHLTQSFIEDNECLHFHMYSPLTLVKEGQLPPENILLIHGDTCSLPDSINYTIPDVVIHDWMQSTDKEDRMQEIKKWINIVKSQKCIKDNPNRCCVSSFILS